MSSIIAKTVRVVALVSVVVLAATACSSSAPNSQSPGERGGKKTLSIMANSISGGKNAVEAEWIKSYVIPNFIKAQKEKGVEVDVTFEPQGVNDEDYKTKIALDLSSGKGADVIGIDGIWTGEFAQAGYIKPLNQVAKEADNWNGWDHMTKAVQMALSFQDERYGIPQGTDGRVIYYNKDLFKKAGLPEDWQPKSWDEILEAGRALKKIDGVTPIQLNAGTAMGEATTMQGFLPMLVGTGQPLWKDGKWMGDTQALRDVLKLYKSIYVDEGLGDPILQQEASGRDNSFAEFAAGKIGMLFEGDYFWRSVINPAKGVGTAPMANRDQVVGYAMIPAMKPGSGINGQDFVSMSGGTGRVINPNSANPDLAWELLTFMNSPEALEALAAGTLSISPREDVNDKLLASDKMLTFVNTKVLPITVYRPGLAEYPEVSAKLQQATLDIVSGASPEDAAKAFADALPGIVGGEDKIAQG